MKKKIALGLSLLISLSSLTCSASHTDSTSFEQRGSNNSSPQNELFTGIYSSNPTELLQFAAKNNSTMDVIEYLGLSPDVNAQDKDDNGNTPLHWAVRNNNSIMVETLISAGANRAIKDKKHGDTPLHMAIRLCKINMVELLLRNDPSGEQLDAENKERETPCKLAFKKKNKGNSDIYNRIFRLVKTGGLEGHFPDLDKATITGKRKSTQDKRLISSSQPSTSSTASTSSDEDLNACFRLLSSESPTNLELRSESPTNLELRYETPQEFISHISSSTSVSSSNFSSQHSPSGFLGSQSPTFQPITSSCSSDSSHQPLCRFLDPQQLRTRQASSNSSISPSSFSNQQLSSHSLPYQSNGSFDYDSTTQLNLPIPDDVAKDLGLDSYSNFDEMLSKTSPTSNSSSTTSSSSSSSQILIASNSSQLVQSEQHSLDKDILKAARYGRADDFKKLIEAKASVNCKNSKNTTPLHLAVRSGYSEMVALLLVNKALLNVRDNKGDTPLLKTVKIKSACKINTINLLLNAGADVNLIDDSFQLTPSQIAKKKQLGIICDLFETHRIKGHIGVNLTKECNNGEIIELLLKAGDGNKTDLSSKSKKRKTGKKIKDHNQPCISSVKEKIKRDDIIDLSFEKENQLDELSKRFLKAVEQCDHIVVELLINAKADVNKVYKNGWTLLHCAVVKNHIKIVELLINAKADVNKVHEGGSTPLHCATANNHSKVIGLLLSAGADIKARNRSNFTPLDLWQYSIAREKERFLTTQASSKECPFLL